MLKIQEFILSHDNWEDKLAREPYFLKIKYKNSLVMFNYTQGFSVPCDIVNEARGLILDLSDNFRVVRFAFIRFYNLHEPGAASINWNSIEAQEKVDGSLIMFYYYNGWHMSTRSTFDAYEAKIGDTDFTFEDVVARAMKNSNVDFSQFNKDCTYVFELVSPETQIIIPYNETKLYYLMTRNNRYLFETYINWLNWPTFKTYNLRTLEEVESFVNSFGGKEFEGVVVKDSSNNRVKIKNLNWLYLHKMFNNGRLTKEAILTMIMSGEDSEFLSYWPEKRQNFEDVREWYKKVVARARTEDLSNWKERYDRKDFALLIAVNYIGSERALMFKAYDSRAEEWVKGMNAATFCRIFDE